MSILQVPLWIVALILFVLAAWRPERAFISLGLAFLAAGFLVAAV
jgi:hypothetical protein